MGRLLIFSTVFLAAIIAIAWLLMPSKPRSAGYVRLSYKDVAGWQEADHPAALAVFKESCPQLIRRDVAAWGQVCTALSQAPDPRIFFEQHFTPVRLGRGRGLITGYHLPLLYGSDRRDERFNTPLYARPPELITVDLGRFRPALAGQRIAGQQQGNRLVPMPDRAAIDAGALADRDLALIWVDDPIEAFFLHIQGSGLVEMPDGSRRLMGYAGSNGHDYRSIGALLIRQGVFQPGTVTAQGLKTWLRTHPEQGRAVMHDNPSFVFFRRLPGDRPLGSLGTPLTPQRSLAVDPALIPLGTPIWLQARLPDGQAYTRFMVAQDTGGAIKGANRADIYFGPGQEAARLAGAMQADGDMILFLPHAWIQRLGIRS